MRMQQNRETDCGSADAPFQPPQAAYDIPSHVELNTVLNEIVLKEFISLALNRGARLEGGELFFKIARQFPGG